MNGSARGFSLTTPPTPSGALPGGKLTLTAIPRRYTFSTRPSLSLSPFFSSEPSPVGRPPGRSGRGRAKAVTFVVAYAPTETQDSEKKFTFWTALDKVVAEVPAHEQLSVLMDANGRTERRGGESQGVNPTKSLESTAGMK